MSQSASRRKPTRYGPDRGLVLRQPTKLEIRARALKAQKAKLIEMGFIAAPVPKAPLKWAWKNTEPISGEPSGGTVYGHTRSDARGEIKKLLGLSKKKRLPKSTEIVQVPFSEDDDDE